MKRFQAFIGGILALLVITAIPAWAANPILPDRILGKADAPVTVEEFISLTCPHCAEFYNDVLPELEKRYVDSGKVRFILRDFPLDGPALKAATIARCMPEDEFYPFISVLYKSQQAWALAPNPEQIMMQYAKLGGLSEEKAKACLQDTKLQDAIVAERTDASQKLEIKATPTFLINGKEKIEGGRSANDFAAIFDRLLADKKQ
jgi:protein-disulfide isomerase